MTVADRFARRHNVRYYALGLEAPEVGAGPAHSDLNLIRDAHAACGPDPRYASARKPSGRKDLTAAAEQRFRQEGADRMTADRQRERSRPKPLPRTVARFGIAVPELAAISVRHRNLPNPGRRAGSPGPSCL